MSKEEILLPGQEVALVVKFAGNTFAKSKLPTLLEVMWQQNIRQKRTSEQLIKESTMSSYDFQ